MRRVGILLLVLGLAGFLVASNQRASYDTVEGAFKTAVSSEQRSRRDAWETGRWMAVGVAVIGLVLVVLPGKQR